MRRYVTTQEFLKMLDLLGIPRTRARLFAKYKAGHFNCQRAGKLFLYPVEDVEIYVKKILDDKYNAEDFNNVFKFVVSYNGVGIDKSIQ